MCTLLCSVGALIPLMDSHCAHMAQGSALIALAHDPGPIHSAAALLEVRRFSQLTLSETRGHIGRGPAAAAVVVLA